MAFLIPLLFTKYLARRLVAMSVGVCVRDTDVKDCHASALPKAVDASISALLFRDS